MNTSKVSPKPSRAPWRKRKSKTWSWIIKILLGDASSPHDFDILLMVEQKNMASFDNAREKFDPIARKVEGSPEQQMSTATKRVELREILGTKLMREIALK